MLICHLCWDMWNHAMFKHNLRLVNIMSTNVNHWTSKCRVWLKYKMHESFRRMHPAEKIALCFAHVFKLRWNEKSNVANFNQDLHNLTSELWSGKYHSNCYNLRPIYCNTFGWLVSDVAWAQVSIALSKWCHGLESNCTRIDCHHEVHCSRYKSSSWWHLSQLNPM